MDDEVRSLRAEKEELSRQLAEARQTIEALTSGQLDTVVAAGRTTPMLLEAAQAKLVDSQRLLRAVYDGALDAIILADDEGRYVDANSAACEVFGLEREKLLGRTMFDFAEPALTRAAWSNLLRDGRVAGAFRLVRPDGTKRDLDFRATANILPGLHLSVLRDMTEQVAVEGALQKTEERLATVVANAAIVLFAIDAEGVYTLHEGKGLAPLGLRPGQLVGTSAFERARAWPAVLQAIRRCMDGEELREEFDVGAVVFETTLVPIRAPSGAIMGMTGVGVDITARKRAESLLRASEERYRRIVEGTSEGIITADTEGRITFANARVADMLGYSPAEMIGQLAIAFMAPEDTQQVALRLEKRRAGATDSYEHRWRRRDGTPIWARVSGTSVKDAKGRFEGTLALVSDITAERRVTEVRNRLAAIVEQSQDAIISTDLEGNITSWNRAAEELYQYTAPEVLGRSITILIPAGLEESGAKLLALVAQGSVVEHHETKRQRKDGSVIEVDLCGSPIRDTDGRVIGVSKILRDLTERRRAESSLRHTEQQLHQAQKMEAIAALAGGVAHDFNNLLTVVLSYAALVLDDLKPGDPIRPDIEDIQSAGRRASELTRQLLAFGRRQVLQPRLVDLHEVVLGIQRVMERTIREDIELTILRGGALGQVFVDPAQVEQVVLNLVVNARDAMPTGGRLTIDISNASLDRAYAEEHPGVTPGPYVLLAVTDTGTGMDAATRERIFEPFFTTKEKSKGSGLGLSTVFGIVRQSGGHIHVYSELGLGTAFKIYFPRSMGPADAPTLAPPQARAMTGSETVLLVEDEDHVRRTVRTILRKQGYNVLEAANGGEALLISEEYAAKIHLLLTDVVMPRMSGRQIAERLTKARPEMRVLFMSGYTEDAIVHHGVLDAGLSFLQKPVTPSTLGGKIREVLDAPLPPAR